MLGKIIDKCIKVHGTAVTAEMLDRIKAQGYKYSTQSGITVAVCDATIPPKKAEFLAEAEEKVDKINANFQRGFISNGSAPAMSSRCGRTARRRYPLS